LLLNEYEKHMRKMLWKTPPAGFDCRWGKFTGKDGFLPVITNGGVKNYKRAA